MFRRVLDKVAGFRTKNIRDFTTGPRLSKSFCFWGKKRLKRVFHKFCNSQLAFTYSKLTIETLEQDVKCVQI